MNKPIVYLLQFVAILMIIFGGIFITGDMINGQHTIIGWIAEILGMLCLVAGSRHSVRE